MNSNFKFIVFVRNEEYPAEDYFKLVVNFDDPDIARKFFLMQGEYVYPSDLAPFISPRQLSRFKTFYNKPRHYDLFVLWIQSYRTVSD